MLSFPFVFFRVAHVHGLTCDSMGVERERKRKRERERKRDGEREKERKREREMERCRDALVRI